LVIAGKGPCDGRLRSLADRLGIADRVEFRGFVSESEKRELLRRAWAHVYTSPREGWGITNVEAAACGTPTVASDSPGLRESVIHQATGLLVPHGDTRALASAMASLAADAALRYRLGEGALRWAQRFSWDRAAALTEEHLLGVLGEQPGAAARIAGAAAT
jgi:glycosyltransferase involved in cell wall biosynthesis